MDSAEARRSLLRPDADGGAAYTNLNGTTGGSGVATLLLPEGEYRFRADEGGTQYWSDEANLCAVPGCTSVVVTATTVLVEVRDNDGGPDPGLNVYVFDGTTYTGHNGTTSVSGTATLFVPEGDIASAWTRAARSTGAVNPTTARC